MTRVALLLLLMAPFSAALASPPAVTGSVTVEQLDQWIAAHRNDRDAKIAHQLAGLKLTERASGGRIAEWKAALPGSRSREALMAVVDAAAFRDPPAAEIADLPAPDAAAQEQMLARMTDYVKQVMPRLPNFIAQRNTTAFQITTEDRLLAQQSMFQLYQMQKDKRFTTHALGPVSPGKSDHEQLFWTGSYVQTVTYRGGVEVPDTSLQSASQAGHMLFSLESEGEFGPILAVVLLDLPRGKIDWARWEHGPTATLAVFRYTVPRDNSHFAVDFSRDHEPDFPAYHGEIAVDPANGAILRIAIVASTRDSSSVYEVSILAEFGPIDIGGITYVSPVRSVAIAEYFDPYADLDAQPPPVPYQTSINDVTFTGHQVFRAKSRVVTGAEER